MKIKLTEEKVDQIIKDVLEGDSISEMLESAGPKDLELVSKEIQDLRARLIDFEFDIVIDKE